MSRHMFGLFAFLLAGTIVLGSLSPVLAEDEIQPGKTYRVVRTDGKEVIGEVTELGNVYKVKVASGITMTLKKNQVRDLILFEEERPTDTDTTGRRLAAELSAAEIDEILGDESVEDLYVWDYIEQVDLTTPFDYDPVAERDMLRVTGKQGKILQTDHFMLAYTSTLERAQKLATRLEAVFKWNVRFVEMMGIPPVRPRAKLEVYFFGTHKEFEGYMALHGFRELGVLGFYHHYDNRNAFFDMYTWPPIAMAVKKYENPEIDYQLRTRKLNLIERYVNYANLEVIQHEAGHHIHFNIGVFPNEGDVPTWLVEGLTMQFEVPPSRLGASLGTVNHERLRQIRQMYGPRGEGLPPMRTFMLNDAMWYRGGGASYCIGWALVNYLYKTKREAFAGFMRLMAQREDDRGVVVPIAEKLQQMEDYFGEIDDKWIQDFKDYIAEMQLKTSVLPPSLADIL